MLPQPKYSREMSVSNPLVNEASHQRLTRPFLLLRKLRGKVIMALGLEVTDAVCTGSNRNKHVWAAKMATALASLNYPTLRSDISEVCWEHIGHFSREPWDAPALLQKLLDQHAWERTITVDGAAVPFPDLDNITLSTD